MPIRIASTLLTMDVFTFSLVVIRFRSGYKVSSGGTIGFLLELRIGTALRAGGSQRDCSGPHADKVVDSPTCSVFSHILRACNVKQAHYSVELYRILVSIYCVLSDRSSNTHNSRKS